MRPVGESCLLLALVLVVTCVLLAEGRRHRNRKKNRDKSLSRHGMGDHPVLEWLHPYRMPHKTINQTVTSYVEFPCKVKYKDYERDYMYGYSIYWYRNGLMIDDPPRNRRMSMTGMSLEIFDLQPSDKGNYTCVVEAKGATLSWSFFLKVKTGHPSSPIFIKKPVNQTVEEGSRVVFQCESSPYVEDEMFWIKHIFINGSWGEGKPQPNDSHIAVLRDWNRTHGPLVLENVEPKDQGFYTCGLRNSLGDDYEAAYLKVLRKPKQKSQAEEEGVQLWHIIVLIGACVLVLIFVILIVCKYYCKLHRLRAQRPLHIDHIKGDLATRSLVKDRRISSSSSCSSGSSARYRPRVPSHDPWEFPKYRFQIQGMLGEGAFGMVKKAVFHGTGRVPESRPVAVKTMKTNATREEEVEFEKELEVMKAVREMGSHLNVINFMGYCSKGPLWMIVELAEKGNLRDYLISLRSQVCSSTRLDADTDTSYTSVDSDRLCQKLLVSFCHQVARGMEFLASVKCIHRDLAARNVLVTKDNVLKVADFGLARNGDYYKKTSSGQLPIKWMPPEALLHMLYTEKSDVWSFGVVMWEIFSLGGMPYNTVQHQDLYIKLIEGYRMERPNFATESLYDTMKRCWNHLPEDRPEFSILVLILERQLVRIANGGYIEVLADDDSDGAPGAP